MPLELSHIGEALIANLLEDIYRRGELANVRCKWSGAAFADQVHDEELIEPLSFLDNRAPLRAVTHSQGCYDCDGMQKVDILCVGTSERGPHPSIAIEAKLGESLLSPAQFDQRFCSPCTGSDHRDKRVRGSMIALLDRKFDRDFPTLDRIEANTSGCVYTVSQHWWLVMRQSVVEQWLRGTVPTRDARIVALEDLIRLFDPAKLDDLVLRIVGRNFARCWGLRFP